MRRLIESLKTLLAVCLGISMLALWTSYIYLQFDRSGEDTAELDRSFWIFNDTARAPSEITADDSFFTPVSVSLILSGKGYTSAYNTELTQTLYENAKPLLLEVFSSPYICTKSDKDTWERALEAEDAIFIEYPSPVPYTTIAYFLQKSEGFCEGELCYVEKLLLFSDSANATSALSIDGDGNVYSYSWNESEAPSLIYDFNSNNLAAYTVNEGFIPFEFNKKSSEGKSFENLDAEYKLLLSAPNLPSIKVENPFQSTLDAAFGETENSYFELVEKQELSVILDAFDINPNIVGYYSDTNLGLIFVGEDMRLVISPTGTVTYTLINKEAVSVTIASLLSIAKTDFTSDEILAAATSFLAKLPKHVLGGDATLILENISYSSASSEMQFTFGYYYNLADVISASRDKAVVMTFNETGLVKMILKSMSIAQDVDGEVYEEDYMKTDIIPSVVAQMADEKAGTLEPIYTFKAYGEAITPLWATGGNR
ncbi:MAG: hypothetical protein IKL05_01495 [Clostridia bacterium]|nr:hypothetical protein [Clostridia bacterium]